MAIWDLFKDWPIIGKKVQAPRVAIIRFSGIISDGGMRKESINLGRYKKSIDKAFECYNIKAVCLVINCPGGAPAQTTLLADYLRNLSDEKEVPVYAFVEDVAASGGYWLACVGEEIYAQNSSIVGSVGVISASFGFDQLIEDYKISRRVHTSGKDKSFMDPFKPEDPKDVKRLTDIQKEIHGHFIDWVQERRGEKLIGKKAELFEGAFWTANAALDLGIIDGIENVYSFAKEKFGENVRFVENTPDKKLVPSLLGARSSIANDVIETLETKQIWQRYGL